jgi:hypothetical protein
MAEKVGFWEMIKYCILQLRQKTEIIDDYQIYSNQFGMVGAAHK